MMPAQVRNTLEGLAKQIVADHEACLASAADAVSHAINAGRKLIEVKESLPHGQFMAWVERNCPFSQETANRYMRVAKEKFVMRDEFDAEPRSINQALRMLTDESPGVEEQPRTEAEGRHEMMADFCESNGLQVDEFDPADYPTLPADQVHEREGQADRRGKPLNGQTSFLTNMEEEESPPEPEPERSRRTVDQIRSPDVWMAVFSKLNSHVCLIENHGGIAECTKSWPVDDRPFVTENLRRFLETFERWIKQLEGTSR